MALVFLSTRGGDWRDMTTASGTDAPGGLDQQTKAELIGSRYLLRFSEDTLRHRPLWIRLIIEFVGTSILVTVAAGSGVINHYVGGGPISRTA